MASAFSIQAPTTAVRLDEQRRALVAFTVGNETGRSLRARAHVTPFEPTLPEWFTIDGETERLLPLSSFESYTVRVAVPPDAKPGRYAFRLDVVSVERPDEEWAHGPAVGFEVEKIEVPPPAAPGYVETVAGAVAGTAAGSILTISLGMLVLLAGRLEIETAVAFFHQVLGGDVIAATAFGGAIGAFAALTLRSVGRPEPWLTAALYLAPAAVLVSIVEAILGRTFFFLSGRPPVLGIVLSVLLSLIAAAASGLAARAFARWRMLGHL